MFLGLLVLAAVAIELEPVLGVPSSALDELRVSLLRAMERRGLAVARERSVGTELLHLSVVGGRSRLEVVAERRVGTAEPTRAEVRGPLEGTWDDTMELLVSRLFPIETTAPPIVQSDGPSPVITYGAASLALISAGLAIGFGMGVANANDELRGPPKFGAELDDAVAGRESMAIAAASFAALSIAATLLGVIVAF